MSTTTHDPSLPPVINLFPGQCMVSRGEKAFATLLGSCVAACIYDKQRGIGGMNHFLLPQGGSLDPMKATWDRTPRYGDYAMELLINRAMGLGAERRNLVAKLFGGATILSGMSNSVGMRNVEFVLRYLHEENIPVIASDLGSTCARKICFYPATGQVSLRRIRNASDSLIQREIAFSLKVQSEDPQGPIIFF